MRKRQKHQFFHWTAIIDSFSSLIFMYYISFSVKHDRFICKWEKRRGKKNLAIEMIYTAPDMANGSLRYSVHKILCEQHPFTFYLWRFFCLHIFNAKCLGLTKVRQMQMAWTRHKMKSIWNDFEIFVQQTTRTKRRSFSLAIFTFECEFYMSASIHLKWPCAHCPCPFSCSNNWDSFTYSIEHCISIKDARAFYIRFIHHSRNCGSFQTNLVSTCQLLLKWFRLRF